MGGDRRAGAAGAAGDRAADRRASISHRGDAAYERARGPRLRRPGAAVPGQLHRRTRLSRSTCRRTTAVPSGRQCTLPANRMASRAYGTEAMHVLRAEKGYIIVGQETDGTVIPADLGLDWAIGKSKRDFVGKRSLMRPDMLRARPQATGRAARRPRCSRKARRSWPMRLHRCRHRSATSPRPIGARRCGARSRWRCSLAAARGSGRRSTCRCRTRTIAVRVTEPVSSTIGRAGDCMADRAHPLAAVRCWIAGLSGSATRGIAAGDTADHSRRCVGSLAVTGLAVPDTCRATTIGGQCCCCGSDPTSSCCWQLTMPPGCSPAVVDVSHRDTALRCPGLALPG